MERDRERLLQTQDSARRTKKEWVAAIQQHGPGVGAHQYFQLFENYLHKAQRFMRSHPDEVDGSECARDAQEFLDGLKLPTYEEWIASVQSVGDRVNAAFETWRAQSRIDPKSGAVEAACTAYLETIDEINFLRKRGHGK